jgi:phage shock protein A
MALPLVGARVGWYSRPSTVSVPHDCGGALLRPASAPSAGPGPHGVRGARACASNDVGGSEPPYPCSASTGPPMFNRLSFRLKARFSRLLDRVESPVEILDYSYEQQLENLYGMRRAVADLVTAKQRVLIQRDRRQDQLGKLDMGARKALELGREDLARQALERKRLVGQELFELNQVVADLEHQQAQMVAGVGEYRSRIQRFRSHKELAKAQYVAAKAQLAISDAAAGLSSQLRDVGAKIERTKQRVEEMNLRADVIAELEASGTLTPLGTGEDDIDRQLREMSYGGSVDDQITRIKLELGRRKSGSPPS